MCERLSLAWLCGRSRGLSWSSGVGSGVVMHTPRWVCVSFCGIFLVWDCGHGRDCVSLGGYGISCHRGGLFWKCRDFLDAVGDVVVRQPGMGPGGSCCAPPPASIAFCQCLAAIPPRWAVPLCVRDAECPYFARVLEHGYFLSAPSATMYPSTH